MIKGFIETAVKAVLGILFGVYTLIALAVMFSLGMVFGHLIYLILRAS